MVEWRTTPALPLAPNEVHVWRVALRAADPSALLSVLSADEQARANRFMFDHDRSAFIVAHGTLRRILSDYLNVAPESLAFVVGPFGKPSISGSRGTAGLEFNLSHSADLALIAVSRAGPVGVDIERLDSHVEHLDLAEQFFSPAERIALRSLPSELRARTEGFFNAWTRKEAYLKATGHGITRGLHHFDVTLGPNEPAELLADRLDPLAVERWRMAALSCGDGYAAALVAASNVVEIASYEAQPAA
jgi:4'-phosphopantetheinyl transferase